MSGGVPGTVGGRGARQASLVFILVTVLLDSLGIGIIIPVVPALVRQVTGLGDEQASTWYALLTSTFALAQFFAGPMLGGLSDRFGRRVVLLTSVGGLASSYALLSVAPSLPWFFLARVLAGATSANVSAANAYVADITPPADRAKRFGLIGATFGVAFVLGPAVGGALGHVSLRLPFLVSAGIGATNFLYGFFVLPESLPRERRRAFSWRRANPLGSLTLLRSDPEIGRLGLVYGLWLCGQATLYSLFVLYTHARFGWGTREVGYALLLAGILQILVQTVLIRRVAHAVGDWRAALLGLGFNAVGFTCYGLAAQPWIMIAGIAFNALGALTQPSVRALLSARAGPERQGEIAGALSAVEGFDMLVIPFLASQVFLYLGETVPGAPFLMPVLAFLVAARLLAGRAWAARAAVGDVATAEKV